MVFFNIDSGIDGMSFILKTYFTLLLGEHEGGTEFHGKLNHLPMSLGNNIIKFTIYH